jgi:glutamate/tyrosine decarboxylase-like PLP-dependent enzyme
MTPLRETPLGMSPAEFRQAGHAMVDRIAEYLTWIDDRSNPVTPAESPREIRSLLSGGGLPESGSPARQLLEDTTRILFDHSLFNGHPRFWGYVTSSPAPIGMLADLLASAVNPNVGAFDLSPVATEIERQTVRWIAEMIGYPTDSGGLLVSGGNQANFVGFLAARKAKIPWDVRKTGLAAADRKPLRVYCSSETHTWIHKAADLFGLGNDAIAWIPAGSDQRMDAELLRRKIAEDKAEGFTPLLVIGSAGTVGTGKIDPLEEIAAVCKETSVWFHVDGAYGGFAAALPEASAELKALRLADSVAVDPHKWLYAPLEAGCALVRDRKTLLETFSYHPEYYRFDDHDDDQLTNFHEFGPQNSRGFRALKVWLALRQAGREGYIRMIREDCSIAEELYRALAGFPELEPLTCSLSITTFRFVPRDLQAGTKTVEDYLNKLNAEVLTRLQRSGKAYPSNAIIGGKFALRVCIVNFRTTRDDILALPQLALATGRAVDAEIRARELTH